MVKISALILLCVALLGAQWAHSGEFESGLAAEDRKDHITALEHYKRAASQGHVNAPGKIGVMYFLGLGVQADQAEALRWYRLGAQRGDEDAQFSLATILNGSKQHKEAFHWWVIIAQRGNITAQSVLGDMYENGQGVLQDHKEAVRWYRMAAISGASEPQNALGRLYAMGQGVVQDFVLGHMWFNISAANGNKHGGKNRDILARQMTPQQLEQAQKMARRCMSSNYKNCD
jgi:TPR repeat protein